MLKIINILPPMDCKLWDMLKKMKATELRVVKTPTGPSRIANFRSIAPNVFISELHCISLVRIRIPSSHFTVILNVLINLPIFLFLTFTVLH
jgi:hypothetical protein